MQCHNPQKIIYPRIPSFYRFHFPWCPAMYTPVWDNYSRGTTSL